MFVKLENISQHVYTVGVLCCLFLIFEECGSGPRLIMNLERAQVFYTDKNYCSNVTVKASRLRRNDPTYYVSLTALLYNPMDNNTIFHFYFYELLSNIYKRTFVEFHMTFCYLFDEDDIIGSAFRDALTRFAKRRMRCPIPAGFYRLSNMTWSSVSVSNNILEHFPFQEGRIYCNLTYKQKTVLSAAIDFTIKRLATANSKRLT